MMVILLGVIGSVLLVVCTAVMIKLTFIGLQMLKATIHAPSTNDDDLAVDSFTDLLEKASLNMTVYDDGNNMEGSIYTKQEVVNAVKKKLSNVPSFTMRCYFNYDEKGTLFRKTFDGEARVNIRTRKGDRPDDTHYKIIDAGRMAYLSQHGHGSRQRKFQVVDCTSVSKFALKSVTDNILGEYKKDIEQKFPS